MATVSVQAITIPTYSAGKPEKNPIFLEKRVYQGSSGRVYPFPVIDSISDTKEDVQYQAVILENEYLRITLLPEIGGRVYRAQDLTNGYDFVYYNHVIKPALVGLAGPWISGGIEFNWPQHHRPSTFSPLPFSTETREDGTAVCTVGEIEKMGGSQVSTAFMLHPGKAYLEIQATLYNRAALPGTFLWWANPAVAVNDDTYSVFPPDVTAVMDHGKRDVSRFPIATGIYYKQDYGRGVDISRYRNIPVPTSYMAHHSDYDFVGNYDEGQQAGLLHIADHHMVPGKKQWTWGCGDFGKAWDRNLTDDDGPYIELMCGAFTDNQPDFSWLMPEETKEFTQYFLPYKGVGRVKNANIHAAISLEKQDETVRMAAYVTSARKGCRLQLLHKGEILTEEFRDMTPASWVETTIQLPDIPEEQLTLRLLDEAGRELVSYTPAPETLSPLPPAAREPASPENTPSNEELYLTGLHLMQYRHATRSPLPYFEEGLRRDPKDSRILTAMASLSLSRRLPEEARDYLLRAVAGETRRNPNPRDGETYYLLGLTCRLTGRKAEAEAAFAKAAWNGGWQGAALYQRAALSASAGKDAEALDFCRKAISKNTGDILSRNLAARLLLRLGQREAALHMAQETHAMVPTDPACAYFLTGLGVEAGYPTVMTHDPYQYEALATELADTGFPGEALTLLTRAAETLPSPLLLCHAAYRAEQAGEKALADEWIARAAAAAPDSHFAYTQADADALAFVLSRCPNHPQATYQLGNLCYHHKRYEEAIACWEKAVESAPAFPTPYRNLSLAYYHIRKDSKAALAALEKAYSLDETDARVLMELDLLKKRLGTAPRLRLEALEAHAETVALRDDLTLERITLLNLLRRHEEAYTAIMGRRFHPWEGGEGKVPAQYKAALRGIARALRETGKPEEALAKLEEARVCPENLGEGKLPAAQENDLHYEAALCLEAMGQPAAARKMLEAAAAGDSSPAAALYYNDQPPEMIFYQALACRKLGREEEALTRFHRLLDYGEQHYGDQPVIDYFAVSLPDLLIFEANLPAQNRVHCALLMALGHWGLGDTAAAKARMVEVLAADPAHLGAASAASVFAENMEE